MTKRKRQVIYATVSIFAVFILLCTVAELKLAVMLTACLFLSFIVGLYVCLPMGYFLLNLIQIGSSTILFGISWLFAYLLPEKIVHFIKSERVHPIAFVPVGAIMFGLLYLVFRDAVLLIWACFIIVLFFAIAAGSQMLYKSLQEREEKRAMAQHLEEIELRNAKS